MRKKTDRSTKSWAVTKLRVGVVSRPEQRHRAMNRGTGDPCMNGGTRDYRASCSSDSFSVNTEIPGMVVVSLGLVHHLPASCPWFSQPGLLGSQRSGPGSDPSSPVCLLAGKSVLQCRSVLSVCLSVCCHLLCQSVSLVASKWPIHLLT